MTGQGRASAGSLEDTGDDLPEAVDWEAMGAVNTPQYQGLWMTGHGGASAGSSEDTGDDLPEAVDWEAMGTVNTPQDQGFCGSCWAHTGIRSIEGIHKITYGKLPRLSVQQIIDCATRRFKTGAVKGEGCRGGGHIHEVYDHVIKYGSVADESYPLRWFWGHGRCREVGMDVASAIDGYHGNEPTEKDLMRAVSKQPVAVKLCTCPRNLRANYKGGIIEFEDWPPALHGEDDKISHTVLVVGYGKDDEGNLFWKILNSYGTSWGDRGYGYLRRGTEDKRGVGGITRWHSLSPTIYSKSIAFKDFS